MNWDEFITPAQDDVKKLFASQFVQKKLKTGEVLFDQGEEDDRLFVLDEGELEVSVLSEAGKKLSLNRLLPQCVFGEIAVFDPGPRTARVEALTACKLRMISNRDLVRAIADAPELTASFLRLAGRRMRWMSAQVEDQVFRPPTARLAAKVIFLKGATDEIKMSQAQLADYVGVTREVVSKTLSNWRRDGIVELTRGRIRVVDLESLVLIQNHIE